MKIVFALVFVFSFACACFGQSSWQDFPQFATGGGITSEIVVTNLTSVVNSCRLDFHGDDGALVGSIENQVRLPIFPYGVATYRTGEGGALITGWAMVDCTRPISAIMK